MTIFWNDWMEIIPSIWLTIYTSISSIIIGMILGLVICWIRIKKTPVLNSIVGIYLSAARSIPMIVVLYILYFALPNITHRLNQGKGLSISPTVVSIIALSLFASAYFGETFRASYTTISKYQFESSIASGMSKLTAMRRIILPQTFALALPNIFNNVMDIVKGTAIIYNVGLLEITGTSIMVGSKTYQYIPSYLAAWTIYLLLFGIIALIFKILKLHINYQK